MHTTTHSAAGYQPLFSLQGKVALITGASSGIGAQQARCFASAGAKLVLVARSESSLATLVEELQQQGAQAQYIVADLLHIQAHSAQADQPDPIAQLARQAIAYFGRIDILCNTAGVNLREPAQEITSASWDMTLDLNLKIPFLLAQALVPDMIARGWGRVINVASLQTSRAFPNGLAYGASKGGIGQLTRAMAQAWSGQGVNCNAIAPGFFPTNLTASVFQDAGLVDALAAKTAIGRNGKLADLDGVNLLLASSASDYVTGQVIAIDGGFTAL